MARLSKEEYTSSNGHAVHLISVVDELNSLSSQEFSRLLKESENFTVQCSTRTGSLIQIDLERLASILPLHLIATMLSSSENQISPTLSDGEGLPLAYIIRGFRLLHSLADIASRHVRFEQILLEDVRLSEQVLDLVFYVLVALAGYKQDAKSGVSAYLLHSALVASSFHLLTSFITSQWQDLVYVLLAHPKVDIFMDVSFDSVRVNMKFLHVVLSALDNDVLNAKISLSSAERTINCICQHCEASLQFILSLCQQKLFRDRLLKNKELCKNGGILSLVQAILDLKISQSFNESFEIEASISRLKSKVLSILLQLCEAENISYLDEVAGSLRTMDLAKSVVLKILGLLKDTLSKETMELTNSIDRRKPKGLVLLNSMRLADIFSDDSNFRSFLMANITWILAEILAMPSEKFLASWCCKDIPIVEEDAVIDYDPRVASGIVLGFPSLFQDDPSFCYPGCLSNLPQASYAQQRTSYLVKIIANLHCFVPSICQEQEKDLFLNKFYECLVAEPPIVSCYLRSSSHKASVICKNLNSLSIYARSLIPDLLNDDDVELFSIFYKQLEERSKEDSFQEHTFHDVQDTYKDPQSVESVSNFPSDAPSQLKNPDSDDYLEPNGVSKYSVEYQINQSRGMPQTCCLPDSMDVESREGDSANLNPSVSSKDENEEVADFELGAKDACNEEQHTDAMMDAEEVSLLGESMKESESYRVNQDDEKAEPLLGEEKQPRKRKRNIMNDKQITRIENALIDEPDMHRNAALLQSWADKLSLLGSELTPSQLKNWLNNRKARLARAAREARAPSEGENAYPDKSYGSSISHYYDSPESGGEESYASVVNKAGNSQSISKYGGSAEKTESSEVNAMAVPFQQGMQKQSLARSARLCLGQNVTILDVDGRVIGRGNVSLVEGRWDGVNLDSNTCVISVEELYIDRSTSVRYPSEAAGTTFAEAEAKNDGTMMVAWDVGMLSLLPR